MVNGSLRELSAACCALVCALSFAHDATALPSVRDYRAAHAAEIVSELRTFLALPNVAADEAAIERNADHLVAMLARRGIDAQKLRAPGARPAVFGALEVPGATHTVVFYAHYDGQPAPRAQGWNSDPWQPVLRDGDEDLDWSALADGVDDEWRIYARSASDDKSPIVAMLAALDALRAAGRAPTVNLKFFFEGDEEAGSPHLGALLRAHRELLAADVWLFADGPVHQSGRGQVVFGVRGAMGAELTVYGPVRGLHSGHYGNWAPNPAAALARLLASLRDADGRITVDGFYDDVRPLGPAEQAAIDAFPDPDEALQRELGIARPEGGGRLVESILLPALNVRGLRAGGVGEDAANAIPTDARASLDFRLVPGQTPARVRALVERHLGERGFKVVHAAPDLAQRRTDARIVRIDWGDGYPALRTDMNLPVSRAVVAAVEEARGERVVEVPNLGGSLPLYLFEEVLGAPVLVTPMVNADNNQHAANENLRIGNLWTGIDMYANLMLTLGPRLQRAAQ